MAYLLPEGTPVFYHNLASHVTTNNTDYFPPDWIPLKLEQQVPGMGSFFGLQPKVIKGPQISLLDRIAKFSNNLFSRV
jgi:hypothetical protein